MVVSRRSDQNRLSLVHSVSIFVLGHPIGNHPFYWNGGRVKHNMHKEHDSRYVRVRPKRTARPKLQETAEGLLNGPDVLVVSTRKSLHCFAGRYWKSFRPTTSYRHTFPINCLHFCPTQPHDIAGKSTHLHMCCFG